MPPSGESLPVWTAAFFIPLYIIMFVLCMELSRRFRIMQVLLYWIMPFILGPICFLNINSDSYSAIFFIYKLSSVVLSTWLIQLIRHQSPKWLPTLKWVFGAIFMVNILEAILFGMLVALERNMFPGNALFGVILLLIFPSPSPMNKSTEYNCVQWPMGVLWITAYSLWIAVFTYDLWCYPAGLAICIYHLGVPLVMAWWAGFDEWAQYRAYSITLTLWAVQAEESLYYSLPYFSFQSHQTQCSNSLQSIINIATFLIGAIMLIKHIYDEIYNEKSRRLYGATFIQCVIRKYMQQQDLDHVAIVNIPSEEDNSEENNLL